jgi:hypothetical protein
MHLEELRHLVMEHSDILLVLFEHWPKNESGGLVPFEKGKPIPAEFEEVIVQALWDGNRKDPHQFAQPLDLVQFQTGRADSIAEDMKTMRTGTRKRKIQKRYLQVDETLPDYATPLNIMREYPDDDTHQELLD